VTGYVGYSGNTAVCTTAITTAAGVIGVYSVGTLPDSRRRGYAETIIRHAVAETSAQTGLERTILQSTRDGLSLYESMGYRTVTRFWVMTPLL
jgi:ribosomal protein S18 acetylase RimI-like enzyme